jgi:branched-subunit amino acid aminotransferase/4-amino-4-deoxychorismate lyase
VTDPVVLVDGEASGAVPATDSSVLRGDGCFEAVRAYRGRLFRLDDHLARLERSAGALEMPVPDRSQIGDWMRQAAGAGGDCVVRVVLTRGPAVPGVDGTGRCIVVAHPPPPRASEVSLWPVHAPWHPAGRSWDLAGAKTISYAPNLAATRTARRHGADDALLISDAELVLEGPTFSVGWCRGGGVFTPPLRLGVLDSITRRVVLELWPGVEEAETTLEALQQADEVFVMSTLREVTPVTALARTPMVEGPITRELVQRFVELVGQ